MKTLSTDVVIIGAGAIGCAAAYFLSREGVKVIVVEKDSIGEHASGNATGILSPLVLNETRIESMLPMTLRSLELHEALSAELKETVGIDCHFCKVPQLILAPSEWEADELKLLAGLNREYGVRASWLDMESVLDIESRLSSKLKGAILCEDSANIESYRYVLALAQAAEKLGTEIHYGNVVGLMKNGEKVTGIKTSSYEITSQNTVLAMGPWAGMSSSWLGFPVPVGPERGQIVKIKSLNPPLAATVFSGDHYITYKAPEELVYTGTTHEQAGFDDGITTEGRDTIIAGFLDVLPSSGETEVVTQSACLRPLSADWLPLIGEFPPQSNAYLATGHWSKGILLSPITALMITELILRGNTSYPVDIFNPGRFVQGS
jgi:glycine oxidase